MPAEVATARRSRWPGSVRLRITLAATLVFAVAFGLASFLLVRTVRASLEDNVRDDGTAALERVVGQVERGDVAGSIRLDPGAGVIYQVISPTGEVVAASPGAGLPFTVMAGPEPGRETVEFERSVDAGEVLVQTRAVDSPSGPVTVAVANPLDDVRETVDTLGSALTVGIPALVVLVAALVWTLVGRALRPVEAIRAEVDAISHSTMHRRVPVPAARDEVGRLAVTMNAMLDRLDQASSRQRQFVSDASHELRSPLATMHAALEVAMRHPEQADWPAVGSALLSEDERMAGVIDELLELSRLDEDRAPLPATTTDLDEIVLEELTRVSRVPVDVTDVSAGRVRGQREQLARLVRNLLANAERHARSQVDVSLCTENGHVELVVDDDGSGIPAPDRARIFDRFTRLDEGRARDAGGAGLGLAIVHAVTERHHGTVTVDDSPQGGARFVVRFPTP